VYTSSPESAEVPRTLPPLIGSFHFDPQHPVPANFGGLWTLLLPSNSKMTPNRVEKSRNNSRKARSRPVSCFFCRSRKLRCSRQFPCTNCASRGLTCQQENHFSSATPPPTYSTEGLNKPSTFETDVLERLRRLEQIVIGHDGTPQATSNGSSIQAGTPPAHPSPGAFVRKFDEYKQSQISPESDVERLEEEITHPGSRVRSNCDAKAERLEFIYLTQFLPALPYSIPTGIQNALSKSRRSL